MFDVCERLAPVRGRSFSASRIAFLTDAKCYPVQREHNLIHCVANRPFYRCGGHIELISREKGDHYYIQTQYNDLFSHYNFFSRKTLRKLARKSMHKY